jgi:hypothetical protein
MLTYDEAISAVESGAGNEYATRMEWPPDQCVGLLDGALQVFIGPAAGGPYSPTTGDKQAIDWIKGGDRPPQRP